MPAPLTSRPAWAFTLAASVSACGLFRPLPMAKTKLWPANKPFRGDCESTYCRVVSDTGAECDLCTIGGGVSSSRMGSDREFCCMTSGSSSNGVTCVDSAGTGGGAVSSGGESSTATISKGCAGDGARCSGASRASSGRRSGGVGDSAGGALSTGGVSS